MSTHNKIVIFSTFLIFLFVSLTLPLKIDAYTEAEEVCYAQCAAYKFVWQGDYCYDLFSQQCSMGSGQTIKDTIKFLKNVYSTVKSGKNLDVVFKAWFVCKPLIEECIVPQLQSCRTTCSYDNYFYAPDLSVGSPYGDYYYNGAFYNDTDKTLTFKVVNKGRGYAWDIGVSAAWGSTDDRYGLVSGGGELFDETISELIYAGARNGPPKTLGDIVTDFLIDESNFASYLQDYKSDADNYNVPTVWYKTIPFTAPEGELTKVIFNVDPNQDITERSETNNTFILEIDKLPTPARFKIEDFSQQLKNQSISSFEINFDVKNTGEEDGVATVKIFEGNYTDIDQNNPIFTSTKTVEGLNESNFSTTIDLSSFFADSYCEQLKRYVILVEDEEGNKNYKNFQLPIYSASIQGQIKDLFGNKVEGATITTSTGQSVTTNQYGGYLIRGIDTLGKITVEVNHPEFSLEQSQKIELKINDINNPCEKGSLTWTGVDFILKDQDVMFTVEVKDTSGNLIKAQVLAYNQDWRFEQEVDGEKPLPGMQPGEYSFLISAAGYKTISQTVNAVPNEQQLEFIMEPLNGRTTDKGLKIIKPKLLWKKDLGKEILVNMEGTKDGNLVVFYTSRNQLNSGKLYFLEALTGEEENAFDTISTRGQSQSALGTSYDGSTTALLVHILKSKDTERALRLLLFNNQGDSLGGLELNPQISGDLCAVSPDGFYLYPFQLVNKGLHQYEIHEIMGKKDREDPMRYAAVYGLSFTTANNVIAHCPKGSNYCVQTINKNVITDFGRLDSTLMHSDSSQSGNKVALVTNNKAYFFDGANKLWENEIDVHGHPLDVAVSMGGEYAIYSTVNKNEPYRSIKLYSDSGKNETPAESQTGKQEDVVFVQANDKGIFYATLDRKILKFYQVASYEEEYAPPSPIPTTQGEATTNNLSYYENGVWHNLSQIKFSQLQAGTIYRANETMNFTMNQLDGNLKISKDTLFSLNNYQNPILLKGQMTADFESPAILYAIKFDRYDLEVFDEKLSQFLSGNLPTDEYFIIKNIHTKFKLINEEGEFNLISLQGEVEIIGKGINEKIKSGRQILIDKNNEIKKSVYIGWQIYTVIGAILVLVGLGVLYKYRKTEKGKRIIRVLKIVVLKILKILKKILTKLWELLKKLAKKLYFKIKEWLKKKQATKSE